MRRLGRVLHAGQSSNVIVKIGDLPKIGTEVVDENLKPVGKIHDIFGPVSSPYASIKTKIQEKERLEGKMLYILSSKKRRKKKI